MMQVSHELAPERLSLNSPQLPISQLLPYLLVTGLWRNEHGLEGISTNRDSGSSPNQDTFSNGWAVNYDEQIGILREWLESMGWKLNWYTSRDQGDEASVDDKQVSISRKQISRHQYYSLLHECGHVDLLTGPESTRRGEPYGYLDLWYGKCNSRTLRHRVAIVMDEISAWNHGEVLAKKLGLSIDTNKYRDFRNRNLKTYFEWCVDPDEDFELQP